MKTVKAHIVGKSPLSFGRPVQSKRDTGEGHDAFEERTWRERVHADNKGQVYIPANMIKLTLANTARFLSESVPGKGKSTWTKHFEAGVMVVENAYIGALASSARGDKMFVPSDGKKGGTTRVWKTFPMFDEWECDWEIILLDPVLIDNVDKVREYIQHAGKFIGIGRWRPRNGGLNGRFDVTKFEVMK